MDLAIGPRRASRDSTPLNGKTTLDHVTCARLPAPSLAALAGLRRSEGISVVVDRDHAWVYWKPEDDQVLRALLPLPGVELFERRGGTWYRPGRHLPSLEVPPTGESVSLDRIIFPEPFEPEDPRADLISTTMLRLVRDGRPRPTSAAICPLVELVRWADLATSASIEAIRGAIKGDWAILVGPSLPPWPGSTRFWGRRILVPIGFELQPSLPEETLVEALGAGTDDLLRIGPGEEGLKVEAIPVETLRPLSRAGIRMAPGVVTP